MVGLPAGLAAVLFASPVFTEGAGFALYPYGVTLIGAAAVNALYLGGETKWDIQEILR